MKATSMRLPDFLIIGAMKSGTTTLYHDLATQPTVFMSPVKEPNDLTRCDVRTTRGQRRYARLFQNAHADQLCGEASTAYSKRPQYEGVAESAQSVLGSRLKVIYIVRNPIERSISHYCHLHAFGRVSGDFEADVRRYSKILDFSRYDMQLEPWLDQFSDHGVHVVCFEDFVAQRVESLRSIGSFLGIDFAEERLSTKKKFNESARLPILPKSLGRLSASDTYRRVLRPLLPSRLRSFGKSFFHRGIPPSPPTPSAGAIEFMIDELAPNAERLVDMLGRAAPIWNLEETRNKYQVAVADVQPRAA